MRTKTLSCAILTLLMLFSAKALFAFGIGVLGDFHGGNVVWNNQGVDHLGGGGGFVMDTNLARDEIFNYRLEFTCGQLIISQRVTYTQWLPFGGFFIPFPRTETDKKGTIFISAVQYFGFGVVRSKYVRFWIGPQLTLGGMVTDIRGFIGGLGMALGLNFNIGEIFTISLVGSGRVVGGVETVTYAGSSKTYGGYGGDGMVTLAFIFRIDDKYVPAK